MTVLLKLTGWRLAHLWGMLASHGKIAGHDDTGTFYVLDGKVYWLGGTSKARRISDYSDFCVAVRRNEIPGYKPGPRPFDYEEVKVAAENHGWTIGLDGVWLWAMHPRLKYNGKPVRIMRESGDSLWEAIRLENWRMDKGPMPTEYPVINPLEEGSTQCPS